MQQVTNGLEGELANRKGGAKRPVRNHELTNGLEGELANNELTAAAKQARQVLSNASTRQKNDALRAMASVLRKRRSLVLAQNALDVADAWRDKKDAAFLDRLRLDPERLEAMAKAIEAVAGCRTRWAKSPSVGSGPTG